MDRKRGQTIRSEARNVIRNVIRKVDHEALTGDLRDSIRKATIRASDYTGVSPRSIIRIRKEDSNSAEDEALVTPGTRRPKTTGICQYTDSDLQAIRNIIYEFYVEKQIVPTGPKLLAEIRERINFPWKLHSLRRLLLRMGYKWKKCDGIKRALIERPNIVALRAKYLKAIDYYRKEKKNIVYIDETWVDTLCLGKWHKEDKMAITKSTNSSMRLAIVHAGGKNGFVEGAQLIFKPQITGDNNSQMNSADFEKWLSDKLIKNIPANSVVVMDNASYHSVQLNKPPSKYGKKNEMLQWLLQKSIPHSERMRKYELYELIDRNKKVEKTLKADEILKIHGHVVLRLPPYMYDLNPMELAWAQLKQSIREKNTPTLTIDEFQEYTEERIAEITIVDWHGFCEHVEQLENEYWRKDILMEDVTDKMDLHFESSDSDSDSDESSSEDF